MNAGAPSSVHAHLATAIARLHGARADLSHAQRRVADTRDRLDEFRRNPFAGIIDPATPGTDVPDTSIMELELAAADGIRDRALRRVRECQQTVEAAQAVLEAELLPTQTETPR